MSTSVFQLIWRFRTANHLALALLVAGAAMLAYDAWLGLRYWDGFSRGTAAREEVRTLLDSGGGPSGVMPELQEQLARDESLLESRRTRFSYAHTDELIELVATTARHSDVALASISVAEGGRREAGPLSYRALALTIRISGSVQRIYDFVGALSEAAPGMKVRSARMGTLSSAPWAAFEIDFQLDPLPIDDPETTP